MFLKTFCMEQIFTERVCNEKVEKDKLLFVAFIDWEKHYGYFIALVKKSKNK